MIKYYYAQIDIVTNKFEEGYHSSGMDYEEYTEFADNKLWAETTESKERARQLLREELDGMWNAFDNASQKLFFACGV